VFLVDVSANEVWPARDTREADAESSQEKQEQEQSCWAGSTRPARWPLGWNLPAFCPQITPIGPFLPVVPVPKYCTIYNLGFERFHGMEEVIGSIPIRSTKQPLQNQAYAGS
jgi:hypothetical protein